MTGESAGGATALPPVCYVRHVTTGDTVLIRRGVQGWEPADTNCSPECLNAKLPRPPTQDEISTMRHGSLLGWHTPGCDPAMWQARRERHR